MTLPSLLPESAILCEYHNLAIFFCVNELVTRQDVV